MLKKLLLATTITLTGLTAISTPAVASNFSAKKMAQTTVDSLEFKDVMRGLYAGKMTQVYVEDEVILKYPHIGLNDKLKSHNSSSHIIALMHPVISYQNHNGEDRYLIIIEKGEVNKDGYYVGWNCCSSEAQEVYADFFIFKDLPNGGFQLVSKTKNSASVGRHSVFSQNIYDIANNIQLLGNELTGAIYRYSSSQKGFDFSTWESLILAENDFVQFVTISEASDDNAGAVGEDTPMHYSFNSDLTVINDGSKYFPIQVHYYGEMPIGEEYQNIRRVDKTETFYYNKAKNTYSKTKPRK